MIETMKNLTFTAVVKFQDFEKLNRYELSKVKGGSTMDDPPIVDPD